MGKTVVRRLFGLVVAALCAACACVPVAVAQDAQPVREVVDPFAAGEGFSAVLYNNPNGLPTSEANAIVETHEGFIWIGSYSGLIRYDGNNFERIDSTTGIASVMALFVDSQQRLWVATNDSGAAVYEQGDFRFFNKRDGLASASVRTIAEDAQGTIYLGTTQGVATIGEDYSLALLPDARLANANIRVLRYGADDVMYGVTRDGAAFTIEGGAVTSYYDAATLGIDGAISILPDPESPGEVYLGTETSRIYHGALEGLGRTSAINVSPLTSVKGLELIDGRLWVCADNGIGAVEGTRVRVLEGVPLDDSVDHVMVDYEGNLWFTSSRQGVMKIVPNQFLNLFEEYGLDQAVVNTTCLYDGKLFLGSDTGLSVVNATTGAAAKVPLQSARVVEGNALDATDLGDMLAQARIRSIVRDNTGNLWLSTYSEYGLVRFDGRDAVCFTHASGLPADRVRTVIQLADGAYMAACTGGAVRIEGDKVVRVYAEADGIDNTEILTVAQAENGDVVLGTDGGGIYVLQTQGTVLHVGTEDGLSSDVIMRLKPDVSRALFWVVSSNSIAYMDADYTVTTVQNFPYPNNFDVYENSQGEVWVLSSNGIYVAPAEELLANEEVQPVYYGMDNGLPCIATANSYSELSEEGELYIAGTTGVARVNIEAPFEDVADVKMAVPFLEADGVVLFPDEDGGFTVPSHTQRLTMYPFVYTYSLLNPQVTYQLEGFEQDAVATRASELVPIDYTNLGGGDYTFAMQLHDAMGHGNQELTVRVNKELALWEMVWFQLTVGILFALAVAGIVGLYFRRKTRELRKKDEENRTYIREMSEAFARVIDMKDAYTSGHSSRVAQYTRQLAQELGYSDDEVEKYYNIALLHDIGKIGVPGEVLNKPGRLTDEEFETIKSHTTLGHEALADISIMPEIATGAWLHHERPDGKGYPQGLKGDEIPRVAQIIAVADCFDAMYSDRPYRNRMNFDKVVSIIREVRGTQLTEDVVDAFLRLVAKGAFRDPNDTGGGSTEEIDNSKR